MPRSQIDLSTACVTQRRTAERRKLNSNWINVDHNDAVTEYSSECNPSGGVGVNAPRLIENEAPNDQVRLSWSFLRSYWFALNRSTFHRTRQIGIHLTIRSWSSASSPSTRTWGTSWPVCRSPGTSGPRGDPRRWRRTRSSPRAWKPGRRWGQARPRMIMAWSLRGPNKLKCH